MIDFLTYVFSPGNFEPHGAHFGNVPELQWVLVGANTLTFISYTLIPIALIYFVRKRRDLVFGKVFVLFGAFIVLCGLHHMVHVISFWYPLFGLQALIDALMAVVSFFTVFALVRIIPAALQIPSKTRLEKVIGDLEGEIERRAEAEKEAVLRREELSVKTVELTRQLDALEDTKKAMLNVLEDLEEEKKKAAVVDKAKTEFVSLASHQLRTPLSTVKWYADMLIAEDVGTLNGKQKEYLDKVYNGNQRMVNLVNDLLNVSRIDLGTLPIERKATDIAMLIQSVIDEQLEIRKKKLHLETKFDESLGKALVDPKLLRMVVQNLVSNATQYTDEGGSIRISVTRTDQQGRASEASGEWFTFEISDTGYGIPRSQFGKIFTKLFRADNVRERNTEGTGLGLYIVKSIVDACGGKVGFESVEGEGTRFFVTLPMHS
ncbi:HAMP domain-containing histidine kinase [Candidatus Kaiserbacteria bacterium]|nr:HAMP domain-containing histidine kinase [Candidatus Kaiserbacteria bacterium]